MGQAVRKSATPGYGAGRSRSHLRLVPVQARPLPRAPKAPAPARARETGISDATCRSIFQVACVVLVTLALLGAGRVALSAQAAEASIDQVELEKSIKEASRVADRLELDRSTLVTPSRIASLAADLQMTKAPQLRYLAVPVESAGTAEGGQGAAASAPKRRSAKPAMDGVLRAAREMTEKEARTLLVGDAGLAATR